MQWLGTYLWMPPECTGLNVENSYAKGRVCISAAKQSEQSIFGASDWYSFGIMAWEMVTQQLPHRGMGDAFSEEMIEQVWVSESGEEDRSSLKPGDYTAAARSAMRVHPLTDSPGQWTEDLRAVAKAYYNGNRPAIPADCPVLLAKLMAACWQDRQQDRPTSSYMQRLVSQLPHERWLGPPEPELTYSVFLGRLGLADKKDELADYLSDPGAELTELKQMAMDELDSDILEDGELGFDEETKERFRAAVAELQGGGAAGGGKESPGQGCAALEAAAGLPAQAQTVESLQELVDTMSKREAEKDAAMVEQSRRIAELEARLAERLDEKEALGEEEEGTPPP
jgi:hypothetical protein